LLITSIRGLRPSDAERRRDFVCWPASGIGVTSPVRGLDKVSAITQSRSWPRAGSAEQRRGWNAQGGVISSASVVTRPALTFIAAEWVAFTAGVRADEFD
jgi:hypothetical protein